uniref:YEATS domain-containing protein n=1 Tax=Chenopodium quinoa TaxID=63459 RepID=A0A803NCI6_CHEQI
MGLIYLMAAARRLIKLKILWKRERKRIRVEESRMLKFPCQLFYGTIAFWLGRKATESQSHKWTVYVRGATNEDLSVVVKRVVFQLHPSFNNPIRVVDSPPFELSECGWGEFEIAISLYFHSDACDRKLDVVVLSLPRSLLWWNHMMKLFFPDPSELFLARVQNHPAVVVPRLPAEADELLKLAAARQQVQAHIVKLRRQMSMVEGSSGTADPASAF